MIHKIRDNWLPICLTIVVVISLVLSWLIWTNPSRYERQHADQAATSTSQLTNKTIGDVYLPTQIVRTKADGSQQLLYAQKTNLALAMKENLSKWDLGHAVKLSSKNKTRYMKYVQQANALMMNYPENVSTQIFNTTFDQSVNSNQVKRFSRIIVPLKSTTHIYLLDDKTFTIYRVNVKKHAQLDKLQKLVSQHEKHLDVKVSMLNNNVMLMFPKQISMPTYSYLLNKQTGNSFITTLMDSSNSSSVDVNKSGNLTTYTDGSSQRMVVNNKLGTVAYENFLDSKKNINSQNSLLNNSFTQLTKIGVPLENIRYDSSDLGQKTVTYRGYVESFPIFNQTEYGAIRIKFLRDGGQQYNFSLFSLQVPVPNENNKVTLPATSTMLTQLTNAGVKTKQIKRIRLAYEWQTNQESNKVLDLKPTYYVYYQGEWQNYHDLLGDTQH
ncbi:YycH family regulatory protein [Paucilactobacillus sp. N302-9]